jgi:hypothetical protein
MRHPKLSSLYEAATSARSTEATASSDDASRHGSSGQTAAGRSGEDHALLSAEAFASDEELMEMTETRHRYSLFGTHGSIDEARDLARPVFGDIFAPHHSDYCGDYWLGHWHGDRFSGDTVKIRPNREWEGEGLHEDAYPAFETLLYICGSDPAVEAAVTRQGFTPLQITESRFQRAAGQGETYIGRDVIFDLVPAWEEPV